MNLKIFYKSTNKLEIIITTLKINILTRKQLEHNNLEKNIDWKLLAKKYAITKKTPIVPLYPLSLKILKGHLYSMYSTIHLLFLL